MIKKSSNRFNLLKDTKKLESKKGKKQNEEIEKKIKVFENSLIVQATSMAYFWNYQSTRNISR